VVYWRKPIKLLHIGLDAGMDVYKGFLHPSFVPSLLIWDGNLYLKMSISAYLLYSGYK
jgi:hypothetical protein